MPQFWACLHIPQARWGTLGDARACRESRQARLEAYVRRSPQQKFRRSLRELDACFGPEMAGPPIGEQLRSSTLFSTSCSFAEHAGMHGNAQRHGGFSHVHCLLPHSIRGYATIPCQSWCMRTIR